MPDQPAWSGKDKMVVCVQVNTPSCRVYEAEHVVRSRSHLLADACHIIAASTHLLTASWTGSKTHFELQRDRCKSDVSAVCSAEHCNSKTECACI